MKNKERFQWKHFTQKLPQSQLDHILKGKAYRDFFICQPNWN
jgi:hypothetical protein